MSSQHKSATVAAQGSGGERNAAPAATDTAPGELEAAAAHLHQAAEDAEHRAATAEDMQVDAPDDSTNHTEDVFDMTALLQLAAQLTQAVCCSKLLLLTHCVRQNGARIAIGPKGPCDFACMSHLYCSRHLAPSMQMGACG